MAAPNRTQKQIAERFKGALDYFKKPHYLRRGKFIAIWITITAGLTGLAFYHWSGGERFYNAGPISRSHSHIAANCRACHENNSFIVSPGVVASVVDNACEKCHAHHDFHQPDVTYDHACTACHREHQGSGSMKQTDQSNCQLCHGIASVMQASAEKSARIPGKTFDFLPPRGQLLFKLAHPKEGYTQVITEFSKDHPEFRLHIQKLQETNTLRFNHQRHFAADIPPVNSAKLDCNFCHRPNPSGAFYLPIRYEEHCATCHSLQFDAENPGLKLPHGNPSYVRAFLRSLPEQYADYGAKTWGISNQRDLDKFVKEQMRSLREQVASGEELERQVFFSNNRQGPSLRVGKTDGPARAKFTGCAYCHEVTPQGERTPSITPPTIPDRWLLHARFNHAKHVNVVCTRCHEATTSQASSDILMPKKATCVSCHKPEGSAPSSCTSCHRYHQPVENINAFYKAGFLGNLAYGGRASR